MKHTSKILIALLVLATMLMSFAVISVNAEDVAYEYDFNGYSGGVISGSIFTVGASAAKKTGVSAIIVGTAYSQVLKMNSSGAVSFTAPADGKVNAYVNPANVGRGAALTGTAADGSSLDKQTITLSSDNLIQDENNNYLLCEFTVVSGASYQLAKSGDEIALLKIEFVPATTGGDEVCNHTPAGEGVVTDPTCTKAGYTTYTCGSCGEVYTVDGEAKLGHAWDKDAVTCTEGRACSRCSATEAAAGHKWSQTAKVDGTCTVAGVVTYGCDNCDATKEDTLTTVHDVEDGKCKECNAKVSVLEASKLDKFDKNTKTEDAPETIGDFTVIYSASSRVDSSSKTFADGYTSGQRINFGGASTLSKQVIKFSTAGAAEIRVWWVCGGDGGRYIAVLNGQKDENEKYIELDQTEAGVNGQLYISTLSVDAAGDYYLANLVNNNYIFKVEVVEAAHVHSYENGVCACGALDAAYVNTLLVGENVIVIDGDPTYSGYNIEYVLFYADENANYKFGGEGVVCWISSADGQTLISNAGVADLEAGYYLITVWSSSPAFVAGPVGAFNVTVTKTAIGSEDPGEEQECQHVYFYNYCTLCFAANPYFENNIIDGTGDHKLVVNEYHLVDTDGHGFPYQFTLFTVAEAGHYKFTSDKFIGFTIFTIEVNTEGADWTTGGASWAYYIPGNEADLEAGTYYIGYIFLEGEGEYNVTLEKVEAEEPTPEQPEEKPEEKPEEPAPEQPEEKPEESAPEAPAEEVELSFFQKILKAIKDFLANLGGWFKNLIPGKKD